MAQPKKIKIDLAKTSEEHGLSLSLSIALKSLLLSGKDETEGDRKDNLQRAKFFIERELMSLK